MFRQRRTHSIFSCDYAPNPLRTDISDFHFFSLAFKHSASTVWFTGFKSLGIINVPEMQDSTGASLALTAAIKICHLFQPPFSFLSADKTVRKEAVNSGLQFSFLPCNGQPGAFKKLT